MPQWTGHNAGIQSLPRPIAENGVYLEQPNIVTEYGSNHKQWQQTSDPQTFRFPATDEHKYRKNDERRNNVVRTYQAYDCENHARGCVASDPILLFGE